jgi:hypothetical protein
MQRILRLLKRRQRIPSMIPIKIEDTNIEILARIAKAASHKFNCSMDIDFNNGNRKVEFVGDEFYKPLIADEVLDIFTTDEEL